jgi:tetratricopeptide (TPR) repeat protein
MMKSKTRTKLSVKTKMSIISLGLLTSVILLEITIRLGNFTYSQLQDYRNWISIKQKSSYSIMCLGESTTLLGGKDSYPAQLQKILNQRNIGIKFKVINKGGNQSDTRFILSHLEENLNRYNPDMVITMMGCNDKNMKYYENIPDKDTLLFKKFRTYRFFRVIWNEFMNKFKKTGFYKPNAQEKDVTGYFQADVAIVKNYIAPSEFRKYLDLGDSYIQEKKFKEAEDAFKKAAEFNPTASNVYIRLGETYLRQENYNKAKELIDKAIELSPNNWCAYVALGRYYSSLGIRSPEKAEEAFKKAIELKPRDEQAYFSLADLYGLERLEEAKEILKKTIEINPKNFSSYYKLGCTYMLLGEYDQGKVFFEKAIAMDSENDIPYRSLAVLYESIGDYDSAQEYFTKADTLRKKDFGSLTLNNYRKTKEILDRKRIKLVCLQYPMRHIQALKSIFDPQEQKGIIFVDNERIFKDALRGINPKKYFSDLFAGDFGHCTRLGNRLIAENVANVILKKIFNK